MTNHQRQSSTRQSRKKPARANPRSTEELETEVANTIHVRFRFKDTEFEASGPVDEVNRYALEYLSRAPRRRIAQSSLIVSAPNLQLPLFATKEDTPQLADQDVSYANGMMSTASTTEPIDICTLFTMCSPKTQAEQVLTIAYHCQVCRNLESVCYDDIDDGFRQLGRCGVSTPTNPRQAIKQLIEKDKLLYRPNRAQGEFALTNQGQAYIQARYSGGTT
jgi:hypothetical protein